MNFARAAVRVAIAIGAFHARLALADDLPPMMDPDLPVHCARDASGLVWRLQCDEHSHVCLYAPNDELDVDGNRTKPLERARECTVGDTFDRDKLTAAGYVMKPGRA